MYEFAAILSYEEAQEAHPLLPRFGPDHKVAPEPGEQVLASTVATGLALYRGEALRSEWVSLMLESDHCYFRVSGVPVELVLTSKRVILTCERFEKGGGWRGSPGLMLTANLVSKTRAAMRTRGKVLAGQMRLCWLSRVGYHDKHSRKSTNALRLVACDTDGTQVMVVITLDKDSSPRAFTKQVFQAAIAERQAAPERLDPQRLARLSRRRLPQYETDSGKLAFHDIPGALSPTTEPASPTGAAV